MMESDDYGQEFGEILTKITESWDTDEIAELLIECEFVLAHSRGRMRQLDAKGFKKLWHIIIGIDKKNAQIWRRDVHRIQEISFHIQKILIKRTDILGDAVIGLNRKIDDQNRLMQNAIIMLAQKQAETWDRVNDIGIQSRINNWLINVQSDNKFEDVGNGAKILLVASDIFDIVHNRLELFREKDRITAMKNLGVSGTIKVSDFCKDIIDNRGRLPSYVTDYYDCDTKGTSEYGQKICQINELYAEPLFENVAEALGMSLGELCIQTIGRWLQDEDETVDTAKLCMMLLEDLAKLHNEHQAGMEELIRDIEKEMPEEMFPEEALQTDEDKSQNAGNGQAAGTEASVLRMTPEGMRLFKNGESVYREMDYDTDGRRFGGKNVIEKYLDKETPCLITAPGKYIKENEPKIKKALNGVVCLDIKDYYMYLWFCANGDDRKERIVAFIEYYDGCFHYSVYAVNGSGDRYEKKASGEIHGNRLAGNIKRDIEAACQEVAKNKKASVFRVFCASNKIKQKLKDAGAGRIEPSWEDILKTADGELRKIIDDMVAKSSVNGNT